MTNILFVCTGNTCRSPMAEGIMRQLAEQAGLNIEVKSAGVSAAMGAGASQHTDTILKERGIDHHHLSQPVSLETVEWADLILTMTERHKDMLFRLYTHAADKIFTLKEFVSEQGMPDVADPFGGSLTIYKQTEKELEELLQKLKEKISD